MDSKVIHKKIIKEIYKFDCYRSFLANFFSVMKKVDKNYTIQKVSDRAGFNNHTYLVLVIQGKRNITLDGFMKLNKELGLEGKYKQYFQLLIKLDHSKSSDKKMEYYNKLRDLKKDTAFYSPIEKQYKYFEKWYYPVIRSLVVNSDWGGDFKKLGRMCFPRVGKKDTENAVGDLISFGLIKKVSNKEYIALENNINDTEVPVFIKKKARLDIIENNKIALDTLSPNERFSVYNTWATSEDSYKKIVDLFVEFRDKANEIVDNDNKIERVYNMLFQIFPNSEKI